MANFKKYALAFAGAACFMGITGTASAQNLNGLNCVANAATPYQVRAEGITENVGDVVLTCTGGTPVTGAAAVPLVNFTLALNTQVTSRLLGASSTTTDSLLLIDEPANGSQVLCAATINNGCATTFTGSNTTYVSPNANVFQGVVSSSNALTFYGIPLNPPGNSPNLPLILRFTNIRANASALGAPTGFSSTSITAFVSSSAGFTISNPSQTVGNVLAGLVGKSVSSTSTSISTSIVGGLKYASGSGPVLSQCTSNSLSSTSATATVAEYVNFTEGFATATKMQYAPSQASEGVPGNALNAESNFLLNGTSANGYGVADYATRVKITFGGIPSGVSIYVPTTLPSNTTTTGVTGSSITAALATEIMQLATATTGSESIAFTQASNSGTSNLPGTSTQTGASTVTAFYGGFAQVAIASGSGTAIYQVTQQSSLSPNIIESFSVPVLVVYSASPATNSPGLGTSTVQVDFAPTSSTITASGSPIPRFIQTSPSINGFTIAACITNLLFPFVTNQAGFDTGIAIAATSSDPFGTGLQSGTCTLNFYGAGAPAAYTSPTVTGGTVWATLASSVAAGFQGYMIAQCKFQFAHGFAFITDGFGGPGRGLSEGYLPLVIPDTSLATRGANPQTTTSGSGEVLSN